MSIEMQGRPDEGGGLDQWNDDALAKRFCQEYNIVRLGGLL